MPQFDNTTFGLQISFNLILFSIAYNILWYSYLLLSKFCIFWNFIEISILRILALFLIYWYWIKIIYNIIIKIVYFFGNKDNWLYLNNNISLLLFNKLNWRVHF